MRQALLLLAGLVVMAATPRVAGAEAEPLLEAPGRAPPTSYWSLTLLGGAAFPLGRTENDHDLGLAASGALTFISQTGIGLAITGGYSPLPAKDSNDGVLRETNLAHAALAPRIAIGRGTLRAYVGGGGGVLYRRSIEEITLDGEVGKTTTTKVAAAAIAEAGVELHVLGAGGLTLSGSWMRGFESTRAQVAAAKAGFVLTF